MSAMTSQITGFTIVSPTVCSGADQRKHQSSTSLAFKRGIYLWLVNSQHNGPVTRKMFPLDEVIVWRNFGRLDNSMWPIDPIWHRVFWSVTHCDLSIQWLHHGIDALCSNCTPQRYAHDSRFVSLSCGVPLVDFNPRTITTCVRVNRSFQQ